MSFESWTGDEAIKKAQEFEVEKEERKNEKEQNTVQERKETFDSLKEGATVGYRTKDGSIEFGVVTKKNESDLTVDVSGVYDRITMDQIVDRGN